MVCVRPGLDVTLLILEEVRAFTKLDLPTFERPTQTNARSYFFGRSCGVVNAPKKVGKDMATVNQERGKKESARKLPE